MPTSRTVWAALAIMAALFVPTASKAVIGEYPDAPLATIQEFHPDWVEIRLLPGFQTKDPEHVASATRLADYVCKLYNRTAVLLTITGNTDKRGKVIVTNDSPIGRTFVVHYTFACAIE